MDLTNSGNKHDAIVKNNLFSNLDATKGHFCYTHKMNLPAIVIVYNGFNGSCYLFVLDATLFSNSNVASKGGTRQKSFKNTSKFRVVSKNCESENHQILMLQVVIVSPSKSLQHDLTA